MTRPTTLFPLAALCALAAACGAPEGGAVRATLDAPPRREARLTLTPAVDLSGLEGSGLADRLAIEAIELGAADLRLLGSHPALPAGGLPLLDGERVVEARPGTPAALEAAFPPALLDEEDLAVYLRIAASARIGGASVVIRGRLHAAPVTGLASLTVDGATDPDGDPAREPGGPGDATDPDGDPARGPEPARSGCATDPDGDPAQDPDEATDPDGDPARCGRRGRALTDPARSRTSVPFELRDEAGADLVARLDERSRLDVVLGIPASRWLEPEVVARLEAALLEASLPARPDRARRPGRREVIVVHPAHAASPGDALRGPATGQPADGYSLRDGERPEDLTVRGGR
jgi:hypothetical protein